MRGVGYLHANCICLPLTESELCHVSRCGRFQTPPPPLQERCVMVSPGRSWEEFPLLHLTFDPLPYFSLIVSLDVKTLERLGCLTETFKRDVGAAQMSGAGVFPGGTGVYTICVGGVLWNKCKSAADVLFL